MQKSQINIIRLLRSKINQIKEKSATSADNLTNNVQTVCQKNWEICIIRVWLAERLVNDSGWHVSNGPNWLCAICSVWERSLGGWCFGGGWTRRQWSGVDTTNSPCWCGRHSSIYGVWPRQWIRVVGGGVVGSNADGWLWSTVDITAASGGGSTRPVIWQRPRMLRCSAHPIISGWCLWGAGRVVVAWSVQWWTGGSRHSSMQTPVSHISRPITVLRAPRWYSADVPPRSLPGIHRQRRRWCPGWVALSGIWHIFNDNCNKRYCLWDN